MNKQAVAKLVFLIIFFLSNQNIIFGQTILENVIKEYQAKLNNIGDRNINLNKKTTFIEKAEIELFTFEHVIYNDLRKFDNGFLEEGTIRDYGNSFKDNKFDNIKTSFTDFKYDSVRYDSSIDKYTIDVVVKKSTIIRFTGSNKEETDFIWLKFTFLPNQEYYKRWKMISEEQFPLIRSILKIDGNNELDNDSDGIINAFDECPNKKGKICTYGCPDPDNDCLSDAEELRKIYGDAFYDRCPDSFGIKINFGCPDFDGDGVVNIDDSCYSVKQGEFGCYGCPDSDNDKVIDKHDKCPKVPGRICAYGCPDKDEDCVADKDDLYPDICGEVKFQGVPDGDGDGFADNIDFCPCQSGQINGCPTKPYTNPQKYVNLGIGLTSATSIVLGGLQKIQSVDIYNNSYNQPIPNNVAQAYYDDANAKHHNFIILTGLGTLGIGYALYSNRIKNKVNINNKSKDCTPLFPSEPRIDFTPNGISIICEF